MSTTIKTCQPPLPRIKTPWDGPAPDACQPPGCPPRPDMPPMAHMAIEHWEVFIGPGNGVDPSDAPSQPDHNNQDFLLYSPLTTVTSPPPYISGMLKTTVQMIQGMMTVMMIEGMLNAVIRPQIVSCMHQNYLKSIIYGNNSWALNCRISSDNKDFMIIAFYCKRLW